MASPGSGKPRVSIIMPVWNRAHLIEHSVRSALAQRFRDFELIVVDDGSTDGSAARALASGDPRVIVQRQPHSGRPAVARNAGVHSARGEYLAFLDSDDLWVADKLERQVQLLDQRPDAAMVYGLASLFDGQRDRGVCGPKVARVPESIWQLLLLDGNFIQTSTVLLRRDVCLRLGGFDEAPALRAVEDLELWLRVTRAYPALFLPHVVARYRVHAGGLSHDRRQMVRKVRAVIERVELSEPLRSQAVARWHFEELKAELAHGTDTAAARAALTRALALDPQLRVARWAERLFTLGLYKPLQLAYRRRQRLTGLRDGLHRALWARRARSRPLQER